MFREDPAALEDGGRDSPLDEGGDAAPPRRGRGVTLLEIAAAVGVAAILVVPLVLNLGWSPILHTSCAPADLVAHEPLYAPGVVGNAPYGGYVWANGSFPWNPPPVSGAGGSEWDGGSFGDLSVANFTVHTSANTTVLGPGSDQPCTAPYWVSVGPATPIQIKLVGILAEGTPGDANASQYIPPANLTDLPSVRIGDRYLGPNSDAIDTCRSSAPVSVTVTATSVTVGVLVDTPTGWTLVPAPIDVTTTYHYWFPPDFGVWQVDDLAQNALLPGAGWAFQFERCA